MAHNHDDIEKISQSVMDFLACLRSIAVSLQKIALELHDIGEAEDNRGRQIASMLMHLVQLQASQNSHGVLDTIALSVLNSLKTEK